MSTGTPHHKRMLVDAKVRNITLVACTALVVLVSACSSSGGGTAATTNPTSSTAGVSTTTARPRPPGPAADVSQELTGGTGPFIGESSAPDLKKLGYVQHEYAAAGTATAYKAKGPLSNDGHWTFVPGTKAAYRTRILVRRPADPARFSGTVIVEWNNVSGGVDADPDFTSLAAEITRNGDAWVGVSAQLIGVEGGPVLVPVPGSESVTGKGLKKIDPARYGSLHHPGDGYAFDIFTQVARALRTGGPVLGNVVPKEVLAAGESQSAFALTTYYDGVQPLTHAFDGFFVHSRGSVALPLVGPGKYADIAGSIGSSVTPIFRADVAAPVLDIQAESDVTGILTSGVVRQPDSDRYRLWEVTGTADADRHLLGAIGATLNCGAPVNNGPMYLVADAALYSLEQWVSAGKAPPVAPRLDVTTGSNAAARRDADGIALGGIRTPPVDVPAEALSGVPGSNPALICILLGSTKPLPAARLAQLYPSRAVYLQRYATDADKVIKAGFVLETDRAALLVFVEPNRIKG